MHQLLSIADLKRDEIAGLIDLANGYMEGSLRARPSSFILATLFFEPSTRTRLGFEAAAYRLGGQALSLIETKQTEAMSSPESPSDTVRVLQEYADVLCIRHSEEKFAESIASACPVPVINAGNGTDEHPSQALSDLFTINKIFGRLDNLKIALVGDLRHSRAAHSLVLGLANSQGIKLWCVSPEALKLPSRYAERYRSGGGELEETSVMNVQDADVVYMAGFAPRTPVGTFDDAARAPYRMDATMVSGLKRECSILCPLPRIDEISPEVDGTPHAKYFLESKLALYMRMAIVSSLLSR
jgi:aspartate carbamoyltransferase catalytic subunit